MESKDPELKKDLKHIKTVRYETTEAFYDQMKALEYLNNPLNDLASVNSAIVYYGTPCCNLRCCVPLCFLSCNCNCDENFKYTTLIDKGGPAKQFLFQNIATLSCSVLGCDKVCRYKTCRSLTYSSYDDYSNQAGVELCEMIKEGGCTMCGLCSLYFPVVFSSDKRVAGIVKYRGYCDECCKNCCKGSGCCSKICQICQDCCYEYFYCCEVCTPQKETVYEIYIRKCCLSCVPIDCCNEIIFTIKTPGAGANVGEIKAVRNCCNFCGLFGTNFTYTINFPAGCTPDLKLTIINAIISIDLFVL